jgi:hypothetical protein
MSADRPGARKIPKRSKEQLYEHIDGMDDLEDAQALKILRNELPWKDWVLTDFLRYWYWLGVFAFEIFLVLELVRRYDVEDLRGRALLAALAVAIVALAIWAYRRIWVMGPFTRAETIRKASRKVMRRRRFT